MAIQTNFLGRDVLFCRYMNLYITRQNRQVDDVLAGGCVKNVYK